MYKNSQGILNQLQGLIIIIRKIKAISDILRRSWNRILRDLILFYRLAPWGEIYLDMILSNYSLSGVKFCILMCKIFPFTLHNRIFQWLLWVMIASCTIFPCGVFIICPLICILALPVWSAERIHAPLFSEKTNQEHKFVSWRQWRIKESNSYMTNGAAVSVEWRQHSGSSLTHHK